MSSELQLEVHCLSCCGGDIWWMLTKKRQAWCYLQVKLCDPCLSALSVPPWPKKRYINTLPFPFPFPSDAVQTTGSARKGRPTTSVSTGQSNSLTGKRWPVIKQTHKAKTLHFSWWQHVIPVSETQPYYYYYYHCILLLPLLLLLRALKSDMQWFFGC